MADTAVVGMAVGDSTVAVDFTEEVASTEAGVEAGTPEADKLYSLEQNNSRLLKGKGSRLKRVDVEKLRTTGQ